MNAKLTFTHSISVFIVNAYQKRSSLTFYRCGGSARISLASRLSRDAIIASTTEGWLKIRFKGRKTY